MTQSPKEQTQPQLEHPDTGCRTQRTPASQPEQEKHRNKKGRAEAQPTSPGKQKDRHPVTEKAENPQGNLLQGSCENCRPRRKSTAQGRNPSDASKTPPTQQQGSIARADQQTGARKVAEPAKGKQRKGKLHWHKVENQVVYPDTANPTINVHCRSRPANWSQIGAEPAKGNQLQDTPRKTASAPGRGTEATPEEAQQ